MLPLWISFTEMSPVAVPTTVLTGLGILLKSAQGTSPPHRPHVLHGAGMFPSGTPAHSHHNDFTQQGEATSKPEIL